MNKILLIGGTDPSGAGLQTDWQVARHLNVNASSIVTAVTAQNSEGVFDQGVLPYSQIKSQLECVKHESFNAIKIGMLGNEDVIDAVVEFILSLNIESEKTDKTTIILDPVLASSSGGALIDDAGKESLLKDLLPLCTLITPNTQELENLTGLSINNYKNLETAAQTLISLGAKNVLVKGGHFHSSDKRTVSDIDNDNDDYSCDFFISDDDSESIKGEKESFYLKGSRWKDRSNVRGTGCSLATAIACQISQGFPLNDAVVYAKALISNGIRNAIKTDNQQQKLKFDHFATQHPFEFKDMPKLLKNADEFSVDQLSPDQTKHFHFTSCDSKEPNNSLGIYPVVDSVEWLEKLIPLGIETIQLRIKDKKPSEVEADIIAAIKLGRKYNVRVFINDYWPLAIKHRAYGVHLGQEDIDTIDNEDLLTIAKSGCRLGISTHSYTEVARALQISPSYLALGPIFATDSKIMPWIPQGIPAVKNWVGLLNKDYPLVAIGGINFERAEALKQTGIGSVAMISEITKAKDYKESAQALLKIWVS